jgi:urease accessory protein
MHPLALLLADGRFPGGGHAHSGGLEAAVAEGVVGDLGTVCDFLRGRLVTTGEVDAWLAAAACAGVASEAELDAEADARMPSPAMRRASRALGRGLRRAASRTWPLVATGESQHYPVVLGAVARTAGLAPDDAAALAVHSLLAGSASAAVRLLPIDAADAMSVVALLAPLAASVAHTGAAAASPERSLIDGPAWSAPLNELRAEDHARWEVRLFAS